jgi:nitroreductase
MKSSLHSRLVPASVRPSIASDDSAGWKYEGTEIPVVGARDVTLAEVANPRIIARAGEEPEAVLLSLSEIEADTRLLWAVEEGKRLNGDKEPEYKVPFATWQEHAGQPVGAWLPEWDGSGLNRSLALAERDYRFAKQALDDAGVLRQYLIVLAARLGRSRRVVGETLGLSAARVQQLSEAPSEDLLAAVEEFMDSAAQVAVLLGSDTCPRDALPRPKALGGDELEETVISMITVGLAEEVADHGVRLTEDGVALTKTKDIKGKPAKSDQDRERVGSATG